MKLDPLDKLFSEFIRRRALNKVGGCERCLNGKTDWKQLQCSHFFGRAKHSVRYDEDNAVGLCGACHLYFTAHPLEHTEWFKQHLGEREFDLLNHRAHIPQKIDRNAIAIYLEVKIKELIRRNE